MTFRKKNEYSENQRFDRSEKKSSDPIFWQISSSVYERVTIVTNVSISIILIFVLILKVNINVNESVISNLIQIATSFGALSLAIPLFLKDFKIQKTLWLSFLTLSILFVFSTVLGIIVSVFCPKEVYNIQFTIFFVVFLIFAINIKTTLSVLRLRNSKKTNFSFNVKLRPSEIYDFIGLLILIIVSFVFSKGVASPFFILFFYSIFVLITVIVSSVITALTLKPKKDLTFELKKSIQKALESNPNRAFSEQTVIDELRNTYYSGISNQVSRTSVIEVVSEMDSEIDSSLPVATIFSYNLIIPRWNDNFKQKGFEAIPSIIFFKSKNSYKYDFLNKELFDIEEEKLLQYLSEKSQLSIELLKDGNLLELLILHLNVFRKRELEDSYDKEYLLAYNQDFFKNELTRFRNIYHTKSVSDLYSIYSFVETNAYVSKEFYNSNKYEIIQSFIELELFEKLSFNDFFILETDEVLTFIRDSEEKTNERDIKNYYCERLLNRIPNQSEFYSTNEKVINTKISTILKELLKNELIEEEVVDEKWYKEYFYRIK